MGRGGGGGGGGGGGRRSGTGELTDRAIPNSVEIEAALKFKKPVAMVSAW